MNEINCTEASAELLRTMEATAARMRDLIISMPPHDLIGYIYAQKILRAMTDESKSQEQVSSNDANELTNEIQFLLEYVHAALASNAAPLEIKFDESQCAELFELSRKLREQAMFFAMATSSNTKDGIFGPDTADIEFHAKSTWVTLRGNRYQALEEEFYRYVLAPHDMALKEVYGVGADDIAEGFQAITNATRTGHADAIAEMTKQIEAAQAFATAQGKPLEDVMGVWISANAEQSESASRAVDDLFRGGIVNASRHTRLPPKLMADLAYQRGEETEFFAPGEFTGTPYRTLPARKKPLIKLEEDFYAIDPCFIRDTGYRALLFSLRQRKPDYQRIFEEKQKKMSEAAFADILAAQLPGAKIFQEVFYKDPANKQWVENDMLILIDDVLLLIEAKAGTAATIASPMLDFARHAQSVQDLVLKAYKQCERFFNYLNSAEEVALHHLIDGKYEEIGRIRRSDYRMMVPIGLTVESFSPFSTYCKELPQVKPLLGKHAFISLSIDDLLVIKRFLSTPGMFAHYLEVRQAVAGMRGAHLFDELDHLGAYISKNRFDLDIADQLKDGKANMVIWCGMSDIIDRSFEKENWYNQPLPTQTFPEEVMKLLAALDATQKSGWISVESHIRNLGEEGRNNLAKMLSDFRKTLNQYPARYFSLSGEDESLFVWLQKYSTQIDWIKAKEKASAAALAMKASTLTAIVAEASADGIYYRAQPLTVNIPTARTDENEHIYEDAERMTQPSRTMHLNQPKAQAPLVKTKEPGRNDPCLCGSGTKYKRCHGR